MSHSPSKKTCQTLCHTHSAAAKLRVSRGRALILGLGLSLAALMSQGARAANDAYSVDATSGLFSTSFTLGTNTPTTGGTSSPASGDALFFGTETTGTTAVSNDLVGASFAGFTFNAGASAFTITGSAFTLTGNITNASSNVQTINNGIAITGTTALTLNNGFGLNLGGNLTGGGTINQTGSATGVSGLALGGDNSGFTGAFTADNSSSTRTAFSTLTAGSAAAAWTFNRTVGGGVALNFGTGTINFGSLSGGGFIRNNNAGTTSTISVGALNAGTTFSGQLQGNGTDLIALTKVGTATLTLSGANSYTGLTTVANGTLAVAATGSLGTTSGVTLGDATANTSGVLQLGDASGAASVTVGALTTAGTGTANAVVGGSAGISTLTINNAAADPYAALLGGAGANQNNLALTKAGAGTLTLTAANTYTGATQINAGALTLANNATAGGSVASSTITLGPAPGTAAATTTVLNIDSSAATASQTTARGAGLTLNGAAGGNGFANLVVTAANVAGAKTIDNFSGPLALNAGAYALPKLVAGASGYEQLNFGSFSRNAGSLIDFSRGGTGTVGATTLASQTAGNENVTFTTAPTLTGGTLGTTSAGIVTGVFVNQLPATYDSTNGLRSLNTATEMTALAASGMTTQNAALTAGATAVTLTADESVNSLSMGFGSGNGGTTAGAFKLTITSGEISVGQSSTLGNATVDFGTAEGLINIQNTRNLTINSVLTGSGGLTIGLNNATAGSAFAILNGADTYTGITRFTSNASNGGVRLTNSLALQNTTLDYNSYGAGFTFGNGTTTGLTAYTFGGLQGIQAINLNNNNTTVGAVALTIGSAGSVDTASTVNTYSGVLSNTVAGGSIIKDGPATQVFAGANTYSGGTTILGGKLRLTNTTGSATGTGQVNLSGGGLATATLAGTGFSTGLLVVTNGSRIAPGINSSGANTNFGSAGTLTLGSTGGMTLTSASPDFDLAASSAGVSDLIATGGVLTLGTVNFTFSELTPGSLSGVYTLVSGATGLSGDLSQVSGSVVQGGFNPVFSLNGFNLQVAFTAVPEPGTWTMLLGGLGLLGGVQRIRRRA